MSIVAVGTVAIDTIETPFGRAEDVLGGSASYFSLAARNFADVRVVSAVGEDFPSEHMELLGERGVDTGGIVVGEGGTFRWEGRYGYDMKDPETLSVALNVLESFNPELSEEHKAAEYVFLANIDPETQMRVLEQVRSPRVVACDTMNFWIDGKPDALREILRKTNVLIINDSEARQLSREPLIANAAKRIMAMGPEFLVIKRGEYGALLFSPQEVFSAPGLLLEKVLDPTGAGDTFAGGFMGYVASRGADLDFPSFKKGVAYGSVMASFTVEDFSVSRLRSVGTEDIENRLRGFLKLSAFE